MPGTLVPYVLPHCDAWVASMCACVAIVRLDSPTEVPKESDDAAAAARELQTRCGGARVAPWHRLRLESAEVPLRRRGGRGHDRGTKATTVRK